MSRVQLRGSLRLSRFASITKRVHALRVRCAVVATICWTGLGCGESTTRVMLLVDADPVIASQATGLRLEIWGWAASEAPVASPAPGGAMQPVEPPDFRDELLLIGPFNKFPRRFAVAPRAGDASRQFLAQVTLLVDERMLAVARVRTGFAPGRVLALPMYFSESCLSQSLRCSATETCSDGVCVPAIIVADTLPDFDQMAGAAGRGSTVDAASRAGAGGVVPRRAPMGNRSAGNGAAGDGSSPVSTEPSVCGDELVEGDETCDPIASCPTEESCRPTTTCQRAVLSGDPAQCTSECSMEVILTCTGGDGCCPALCAPETDSDCSAKESP